MDPPIRSGRPPRFRNNRVARSRPSIGRRVFRPLARISIAILIGVVATAVWRNNGDKAKEIVRILAPSLSSLLPDTTTTAGPATSRELVQQLAPIARDLAAVRRSVEQVAAKQEQMDQNIVTLQAIEQEIRQKVMSSPPPSRAAPAQPKPPPPAAQSFTATPPPPPAGPPLR
jgi:endonuclease/exonuclease/phosphatase (EEP) superfamily protein YafD